MENVQMYKVAAYSPFIKKTSVLKLLRFQDENFPLLNKKNFCFKKIYTKKIAQYFKRTKEFIMYSTLIHIYTKRAYVMNYHTRFSFASTRLKYHHQLMYALSSTPNDHIQRLSYRQKHQLQIFHLKFFRFLLIGKEHFCLFVFVRL